MALNTTPVRIQVPSRDEIVAKYKRDYLLRDPKASAAVMEQVDVDARVLADLLLPVHEAARQAGDALTLLNQTGDDLDNTWGPRGIPRVQAQGASGYVRVSTSSGGGPIFEGDEIKDLITGIRFRCLQTNLSYRTNDLVAIGGVDTGPSTNLPPGTKLTWSLPRPGVGPTGIVETQGDGEGLVGGRDRETDDDYKRRIADYQANPPAAGNSADVMRTVETITGVPVQKAFVYPAILGSGTCGVAFTTKPARSGGSRLPTEFQRGQVESFVVGNFPKGDIYYTATLLSELIDVVLEIRWASAAAGWTDIVTWPPRLPVGGGRIQVASGSTSATAFTLETDDGNYAGVASPQADQTVAFFNASTQKFSRKRIATVTGSGPWAITCSTTLSASDTSYTPTVGQVCCPWSDSLDALVAPLLAVFDGLGPGEMVANVDFLMPGERKRREPQSPTEWPSLLSNQSIVSALKVREVANVTVLEGADAAASVGTPGVLVNVLSLGNFACFPKAA